MNAVLPGWIDTDLTRRAREQVGEKQEAGATGIARAQARREGMNQRLLLGDRRRKTSQERGVEHE